MAIHQPNFFPYAGVLAKARRCDRFVVLTQAQYARGNYHNRFLLADRWYTLAVNQSLEPLACKRYCSAQEDWATIKRRLPDYASVLSLFDD
ncbi:MAG: WbqC family protein, partial [Candidatus Micrarchaeota archaeon]|nr:WbqC family protein [Candidatus Micrarchaeota archaeon]